MAQVFRYEAANGVTVYSVRRPYSQTLTDTNPVAFWAMSMKMWGTKVFRDCRRDWRLR